MNVPDRAELLAGLDQIWRALCSYGGGDRCDCKYGADNVGAATENGCGCPEARAAAAIIRALTPREFELVLQRIRASMAASVRTVELEQEATAIAEWVDVHDGDVLIFKVRDDTPPRQLRAFRRMLYTKGQELGWEKRGILALAVTEVLLSVTCLRKVDIDRLNNLDVRLDAVEEKIATSKTDSD